MCGGGTNFVSALKNSSQRDWDLLKPLHLHVNLPRPACVHMFIDMLLGCVCVGQWLVACDRFSVFSDRQGKVHGIGESGVVSMCKWPVLCSTPSVLCYTLDTVC